MVTGKPILVTGLIRSGTTWIGDMIAAAPGVVYMQEPFNPQFPTAFSATTVKRRLMYICKKNENEHYADIKQIMELKIPFLKILKVTRKPAHIPNFLHNYYALKKRRDESCRPLMKDPLAFFSTEWLAERFNMDVIVSIRHPAAFVSSMKVKNWKYGLRALLNQPLVMKHHLSDYKSEMIELVNHRKKDVVGFAILGWKIFFHMVSRYEERHPDWLFIRHEDLSADPISGYHKIYQQIGLDLTDLAKQRILEFSSAANPVEQHDGHKLKRDSRSNISTWKSRLTAREIERVKKETFDPALKYYSESDW
ncbi:MAG: sulfotransferase [Desulfobacterales bacterium]|nr:sulfotransferase [Desulfobacterales bacterium]